MALIQAFKSVYMVEWSRLIVNEYQINVDGFFKSLDNSRL